MRKRIAWLITTGLIAGSLAIPGMAFANTNEAIAETGGMELALLGSGFTVDVGLDDFGNIASVDVADPTEVYSAARFGRDLKWNDEIEEIVGDSEANSFLARPYRSGYEIEM